MPRYRKLTKSDLTPDQLKVWELLRSSHTSSEIAEIMGWRSRHTVKRALAILREAGVNVDYLQKRTIRRMANGQRKQTNQLLRLRRRGLTIKEAAGKVGISQGAAENRLRTLRRRGR